jgi:hypothetical protein
MILHFLHGRPKMILFSATFEAFQGISHLISEVSNCQHHKNLICIVARHFTAPSSIQLECPVTKSRGVGFYPEYTHFEGVLHHSANLLGPGVNFLQNKSTSQQANTVSTVYTCIREVRYHCIELPEISREFQMNGYRQGKSDPVYAINTYEGVEE